MVLKKMFALSYFSLFSFVLFAQTKSNSAYKKIEFGTEFQIYPVGFITAITSNIFIKENLAMQLRIGANFTNRQNFSGLNDNELVKGFGGSIGLLKYFPYRNGSFIAGAHIDGWNMWTAWKDGVNTLNSQSGTTYNLVVQPWVNGGYLYDVTRPEITIQIIK